MATKTVETFRATAWLRTLVRRAARLEQKRPSEFLRQAAEEKAKQVIREHERARVGRMLAQLPPGTLPDDAAARLGREIRREAGRKNEPPRDTSRRSRLRARRSRAS
jgi:hypothetical protein